MTVQKCRGTHDLMPEEMQQFRRIEGVFRQQCVDWGYREVRTPTLEYLHLFTATGTLTPNRLHKVYSFLDWDGWSGERVVLRPDGTIPIARLYIECLAKSLAKLFYITNVFSFEETGRESRERWQCGVELIGAGSPVADAELVSLALAILKKLGIGDVELRLSHAGMIRGLLTRFGLSPDEQSRVFEEILDGDMEALVRVKPEKPELGRALAALLDLKGKSSGFLKNMESLFSKDLPEIRSYFGNFTSLVELLERLGVDCRIDITSGSGFEYYTGIMYHLFAGGENIGGGGRYDALIPLLGGEKVPASGFALYVDKLMARLIPATAAPARRVLVKAPLAETPAAFELAALLRRERYIAELDLGGPEPADLDWKLEMAPGGKIVLTDRAQHRFEAGSTTEALTILKTR